MHSEMFLIHSTRQHDKQNWWVGIFMLNYLLL